MVFMLTGWPVKENKKIRNVLIEELEELEEL